MPALGRADRPRGPGVVRAGLEAVVRALAVDVADRVDRREVDDVEAHRGDRRAAARPRSWRTCRPRCAGRTRTSCRTALAAGPPRSCAPGDAVTSSRIGCWRSSETTAGSSAAFSRVSGSSEAVPQRRPGGLRPASAVPSARTDPLVQPGALLEHQLDVDAGLDLQRRVVPPGPERVAPALDREGPGPSSSRTTSADQVSSGPGFEPHERRLPSARALDDDVGSDGVVTLAKHLRAEPDSLARDGPGGVVAAGHRRGQDFSQRCGPTMWRPYPCRPARMPY